MSLSNHDAWKLATPPRYEGEPDAHDTTVVSAAEMRRALVESLDDDFDHDGDTVLEPTPLAEPDHIIDAGSIGS